VRYHDGKVDLRVTTRDVWTLNPGFNFGRSGGTNSTGVQLEELNVLGTGVGVKVGHKTDIDRTEFSAGGVRHARLRRLDGRGPELREPERWPAARVHAQSAVLRTRHRWAGGLSGRDDLQTDKLYDRGQIIDQFQDRHQSAQVYGGWSNGLQNGWVRRWRTGVTYDERRFQPLSTSTGVSTIPQDRRFLYPWVQFDLVQDQYLKLFNHDQTHAPRTSISAPPPVCVWAGRTRLSLEPQRAHVPRYRRAWLRRRGHFDAAAGE